MKQLSDNSCTMNSDGLFKLMCELVPHKACNTEDFPQQLSESLERYISALEELELTKDNRTTYDSIVSNAKSITSAINLAVTSVYEGKPADAFSKIHSVVPGFLKLVQRVPAHSSFYRMRSVGNADKSTLSYKDMFHIPFSKRGIVSTQRYSIPGYPCLYLSEKIFGCWKELGQPDLDSCMVSRLTNERELSVWDLRIPDKSKWNDSSIFECNCSLFPLVIACMFRVKEANAVFKPEYIIPQLLLQVILDNKTIDGIVYTSVHNTNDFKFPDFVRINYVFPVKEQKSGYTHCPQLCDMFRITKPTCEEYERIKHGSIIGPDGFSIVIPEDVSKAEAKKHYNYEMSLFRSIERNLENTRLFGLKKINPLKAKS